MHWNRVFKVFIHVQMYLIFLVPIVLCHTQFIVKKTCTSKDLWKIVFGFDCAILPVQQ